MHIDITDIGVPPGSHQTCRKISTLTGPLFRDGGFYIVENQNLMVCVLQQIYKLEDGEYLPVAEILEDVSRRFHDPFLAEMKVKTWKRTRRLLIIRNLENVSYPKTFNNLNSLFLPP